MKKALIILPLAAMALTACTIGGASSSSRRRKSGGGPTTTTAVSGSSTSGTGTGGTDTGTGTSKTSTSVPQNLAEEAVDYVKTSYVIASVNGKTSLYADDEKVNIGRDKDNYHNDYLSLTTVQSVEVGDDLTSVDVEISWEFDREASFIKDVIAINESHDAVFFIYDSETEYDFPFKATLKCGDVTDEANFEVHLMTKNLIFDEYSIAELYALKEDGTNFALVDETTGYYIKNNENFTFTCVSTYGEVVYVSPDGNWALIGDGSYILELYSGSELDLNTTRYPSLEVGKPVYVEAELGSYKGNLQVSYIFDISDGDASKIASPTGFAEIHASDYLGKHYWENSLMNSLRVATGTYAGNVMKGSTAITDLSKIKSGDRFTFDITVDGETLTIAYDYHVDRNGDKGVFSSYIEKLGSLNVGDPITVKGTFRFCGSTDKGYKDNMADTNWNLVPYLADHIA